MKSTKTPCPKPICEPFTDEEKEDAKKSRKIPNRKIRPIWSSLKNEKGGVFYSGGKKGSSSRE